MMLLKSICGVVCISNLLFLSMNNTPLYGYTIYLSIYLLIGVRVVSAFGYYKYYYYC